MKMIKLISPDFAVGKLLVLTRAVMGAGRLMALKPSKQSLHLARLVLRVSPTYTMVSPARLANLYTLVHQANVLGLPGDLVECGVWNGGSAAVMASACVDDGWMRRRTLWLFDSFQGLPPPGEEDGTWEQRDFFPGWCKGDPDKVHRILRKQGIPLAQVRVIPGWLSETLRSAPVHAVAVLHVDVDWHDAVKCVLEVFYERVVPGGFVVFDDYGTWQGCRLAVDRFLAGHQPEGLVLQRVARAGAYFQKPLRFP